MPALLIPKNIKNMMDEVRTYRDGYTIREDAPDDIKRMDKEISEWFHEQTDGFM